MTYRIGAVSYLNTKPLVYELPKRLPDCTLHFDLPSRLADQLLGGYLDIALIPSVEFLRGSGLSIVSDACIACRGPVRSVRLLFRCQPQEVRTLALDEGSRTSAVLAQVLLFERYGIRPALLPLQIEADCRSVAADALLVIGDRAMQIDSEDYVATWDLGEQWNQETGKPFVFAMWVAAQAVVMPRVSEAFQRARDAGLENLQQIAGGEAAEYDLSVDDCYKYFSEQLYFYLGQEELAGLDLFRSQAAKLGLVPEESTQLSLLPI